MYGSGEERITALEELDFSPMGIESAYQFFLDSQDPEFRIALLEQLDQQSFLDLFLSRQMILEYLQQIQ